MGEERGGLFGRRRWGEEKGWGFYNLVSIWGRGRFILGRWGGLIFLFGRVLSFAFVFDVGHETSIVISSVCDGLHASIGQVDSIGT